MRKLCSPLFAAASAPDGRARRSSGRDPMVHSMGGALGEKLNDIANAFNTPARRNTLRDVRRSGLPIRALDSVRH